MPDQKKGYAAKKGEKGFRTRAGFATIGDEIQALMGVGATVDPPTYAMQVFVPPELTEPLREEASKRGVDPQGLVRDLLRAIVQDDMYSAVLDV